MAYLKLDYGVVASGWTARLTAGPFAAWVKLLLEAKQWHRGGIVPVSKIDREWRRQKRISEKAWNQMLDAAQSDDPPAVTVSNGVLRITAWHTYQTDPTNARRQQRYRQRQAENPNNVPENGGVTDVTRADEKVTVGDRDRDREGDRDGDGNRDRDHSKTFTAGQQQTDNRRKRNSSAREPDCCCPAANNHTVLVRFREILAETDGNADLRAMACLQASGSTPKQVADARRLYGGADILAAVRYTLGRKPVPIDPGAYIAKCLKKGHHRATK